MRGDVMGRVDEVVMGDLEVVVGRPERRWMASVTVGWLIPPYGECFRR